MQEDRSYTEDSGNLANKTKTLSSIRQSAIVITDRDMKYHCIYFL